MTELKAKHLVCVCLISASCFILKYVDISLWKIYGNKNIENVPITGLGLNIQHVLKRNHDNHTIRYIGKHCFHLSFNLQALEDLAKIKDIDSDSEKGTNHDNTGLAKTKGVEKIHSKGDSMLCTRFVTITSYEGRMGNQMFKIASLVGLAYTYDVIPIIPPWVPLNKYFYLPFKISTKGINISNAGKCISEKAAKFYDCSKAFSSIANISVHGYLQSWKYFVNASDIIRKTFTFKPKYLSNAKRFLSNVSIDGYQRVCIHVRRGDFTHKINIEKGHIVAGLDFIQKAKNFFIGKYTKVQFLVVSDDKTWCRMNMKDVVISPFTDPGEDMALMMLSDHMVVTGGTFGWWGAWLSGGTTVYFDNYARPGSRLASSINGEDHFPITWIEVCYINRKKETQTSAYATP